jgi:hypothetical protein
MQGLLLWWYVNSWNFVYSTSYFIYAMSISTFFTNKKNLRVISDLLILLLSLVAVFFRHVLYDFSIIIYYSTVFLLFLFIMLSIYIKLYTWRKLDLSVSSFIFYLINFIQLILYCFTISFLLNNWYYDKVIQPIYLENLSVISQYRYLFLSVISFFVIFSFIVFYITNCFMDYKLSDTTALTYPYSKEEIRKVLYTWNDTFMGDFCNKIIDLLYFSSRFRMCFFVIHFTVFFFTRLTMTFLLFYCTFYHGDFMILLYLTPLMLCRWLLYFFNYYFITFQKGCANYIRSLVLANLDDKGEALFGVFKVDPSQISFKLTEEALLKGYTDADMYNLTKEWYIQAQLSSYFRIYFALTNYIGYFILLLQLIIWFSIAEIFFFTSIKKYFISTNFLLGWGYSLGRMAVRSYVTEARRVLPPYQKKLAQDTEGAHQGSHPALVDPDIKDPDNASRILYEGQPTHGKGGLDNPSYPLHPFKDLQGNPRPQRFVPPPSECTYVEEHYFASKPIPDSGSFLKDEAVKENLAKYSPRSENT